MSWCYSRRKLIRNSHQNCQLERFKKALRTRASHSTCSSARSCSRPAPGFGIVSGFLHGSCPFFYSCLRTVLHGTYSCYWGTIFYKYVFISYKGGPPPLPTASPPTARCTSPPADSAPAHQPEHPENSIWAANQLLDPQAPRPPLGGQGG